MSIRVAVLTPGSDYRVDWRWAYDVEADALTDAGMDVTPMPWTEPGELAGFDLILPLLAWGYHNRFDDWLTLLDLAEAERLPMINPPALLRWNSDKAYLAELGRAGIATVPTIAVDALDEPALDAARAHFRTADLVVKPPVSASANGTFRLAAQSAVPDSVRGRRMMVQPWLPHILDHGEYSLILFDGRFSHAVSKLPRPGEFRVQPEYGGIITGCGAPEGAIPLALAALAAAPARSTYARVDLVVGGHGELMVIELELIEPALWLDHAPDRAAFARAVASAAERAGEQPLAQGRGQIGRRGDVQAGRVDLRHKGI